MKLIRGLIDFVLYTSLFTACCATGLCMATERLISAASPPLLNHLHLLVFGSTLLVYNAPRLIIHSKHETRPARKFGKGYLIVFFSGMILTIAGLYLIPEQVSLAGITLGIFAFAYFSPVLPFKGKKRLRDFGWLKLFVLAGVWTTATSILPILYLQKSIGDYPFEILLRLVFIFTLCVIFDIRDMQTDLESNIYTLPHKVGLKNSYRLINTALLLFIYLSIVQYFHYPVVERLIAVLVTAVATRIVVSYLRRRPSERAYLFLADGVMLLYALLILLPPQ